MDYYGILGVPRGASSDEIKKAYRKLSKQWHPDKHSSSSGSGQARRDAEEKYKEINRAYEALSDPEKRKMYDQFGTEEPFGAGQGGARGSPFGHGFSGAGGAGDFGDLFETFFGGGAGRQRRTEVQGRDIEVVVTITLAEAYGGVSRNIRMRKLTVCGTCSGTGAASGSKKVECKTCHGTGQVTRTAQSFFGMIRQSVVCEICKGSGKIPESPCNTCRGEGRVEGSEEITVEIPAGIGDGQTLRLRGKGEAGRQGIAAGDLYVAVRVTPAPRFVREGDHLRMDITIVAPDAALGTEVSIETLGGALRLNTPAGTQPGDVLRVRGKGMPVLNTSRFGDLFVQVNIAIPRKMGHRERELWEGLRKG